MDIMLANLRYAYGSIAVGILAEFFALKELLNIKEISGYFLIALLAGIGYLFFMQGFKLAALYYNHSDITIYTLRKKFIVPLKNVNSIIKRSGAGLRSNSGYLFKYKVSFVIETGENINMMAGIQSKKIKDLSVLASLIKLKNPSFIFEDLI